MRTSRIIITSVVSIIAVAILARVALARDPSELPEAPPIPDNGFTYQGLVKDEGRTANGAYDFEFALFYATSGVQVGNTIIKNNLPVVNGLVSTQLDFGPGIFVRTRLLLETRTRKGDQTGAFDTLISRVQVSAVPYAAFAYDGPFWMLECNAGTTSGSGSGFVGTTDAQPLVSRANNTGAMRISPTGKVEIGDDQPCDTHPSCLFYVSKSGANRVRIYASDSQQARLDLHSGDSQMILTYNIETAVKFFNGDRGVTDLFIQNSNGFVGINTGSSPNAPLEVHGENVSHYEAIFKNISANSQGVLVQATDGNGPAPVLHVENNSQNPKLVVR